MKKILNFGKKLVVISQDDNASNPREDAEYTTKVLAFHNRYNICKEENTFGISTDDYDNFAAMEKDLRKNYGVVVCVPLYMYDHSGIALSTTSFNDRWDSGQLGFIVATRADICKGFGVKIATKKIKERIKANIILEVETLNQYYSGEVYGFQVIDVETENEIDSCWGFFGDNADNGIFDNLDIENLTFEDYSKKFNDADWESESVEDYLENLKEELV